MRPWERFHSAPIGNNATNCVYRSLHPLPYLLLPCLKRRTALATDANARGKSKEQQHQPQQQHQQGYSRRSLTGNERKDPEAEVKRLQAVATRASAVAAAARTRLALVKAWEVLSSPAVAAASTPTANASSTNDVCDKPTLKATCAVQRDHRGSGMGAKSTSIAPDVARAVLERACRLARVRVSFVGKDVDGGGNIDRGKGVGLLAGPLASPMIDVPRRADVEKAVVTSGSGDDGAERKDDSSSSKADGVAVPRRGAEEACLLCGAAVDQEAGMSGNEAEAAPVESLPGWAVCRRRHRVRRCMHSFAPTLAVEFRRCQVCRCVLEITSSQDGRSHNPSSGQDGAQDAKDEGNERHRGVCVFCNVLLVPSGSNVVGT